MKTILLISAIAIIGFASCKKEENKNTTVKYEVDCPRCTVIYDDQYNEDKKTVVSGKWSYEFEAGVLDSAKLTTQTPATAGYIPIKATIYINNKIVASTDEEQKGIPFTQAVELKKYKY